VKSSEEKRSQEHQLIAEEWSEFEVKKSKIPKDLVLFNTILNWFVKQFVKSEKERKKQEK